MKRLAFISILLMGLPAYAAGTANAPIGCESSETYYPLGYFWAVVPPISENPVVLHQSAGEPNTGGGAQLSASAAASAVQRGFNKWGAAPCGAASANLLIEQAEVLYGGGDRGDIWTDTGPTSTQNTVVWDSSETNVALSSSTVAYTEVLFFNTTGLALDGDLMFNGHDYAFRVDTTSGSTGCDSANANCYDIESVALHEAGHFAGFGHVECTDSIMFSTGSGNSGDHELSSHELAGVCDLYPARASGSERAAGERCTSDIQCPSGFSCINPAGNSGYGSCSKDCSSQDGCPAGFICVTETVNNPAVESSFCRPGYGVSATPVDICEPCSSGEDCNSGFCLSDGVNSFCSEVCQSNDDCEANFTCMATDAGTGGCFPLDSANCGDDPRAGLNEVCFIPNGAASGENYFNACKPDLICFGFQPLCGSITGACVLVCDANHPCPEENLTCCAGQDSTGSCKLPGPEQPYGGCFDVQSKGQSCVSPEQSICDAGNGCYHFGETSASQCYAECAEQSDCASGELCKEFEFDDSTCEGAVRVCCRNDREGCVPADAEALLGLGMRCILNADCDTGLCLKYQGEGACSRSCDPVTQVGCEQDNNADGVDDGGFECLAVGSSGRCWPIDGPMGELGSGGGSGGGEEPEDESSGCSSALGNSPSLATQIFNLFLFVPLVWMRFRRRRQY